MHAYYMIASYPLYVWMVELNMNHLLNSVLYVPLTKVFSDIKIRSIQLYNAVNAIQNLRAFGNNYAAWKEWNYLTSQRFIVLPNLAFFSQCKNCSEIESRNLFPNRFYLEMKFNSAESLTTTQKIFNFMCIIINIIAKIAVNDAIRSEEMKCRSFENS